MPRAEVVPDVDAGDLPREVPADIVELHQLRKQPAYRLRAGLGLPGRLSECGATEEDLDAVARMSQGNVNVGFNPRPVSEEAAREILAEAW